VAGDIVGIVAHDVVEHLKLRAADSSPEQTVVFDGEGLSERIVEH
jgi:hypothetical protein